VSITGKQGFVFSLDLAIAFIAMLLMLSLMLSQISLATENELKPIEKIGMQRKAIFLVDAMVKNRNEEQPLLGSTVYDLERHRVLQNEIDFALLLKAKQLECQDFFVSRLSLASQENETIVFEKGQGKNCVSLDRLVNVNGKLGKVGVVVCEKKE